MVYQLINETAPITQESYGARAKCLQRLIRLGLPVPKSVALSVKTVQAIANGENFDCESVLALFAEGPFLSARPSAQISDWGGPGSILNIGITSANIKELSRRLGQRAAGDLHHRFVKAFAVDIARLDAELFANSKNAKQAKAIYEIELDAAFPEDPAEQLIEVLRSMARAWSGRSARLLRQAKGAPIDAGLGIVLQSMVFGLGYAESGAGVIQFINTQTGIPQISGRYMSQGQGRRAMSVDEKTALYLTEDPRGPSLEGLRPKIFSKLIEYGDICRKGLREEMQIEFAVERDEIWVIEALRAPCASRASVKVAVDLANSGVITSDEALLRVEPTALSELLHPQLDPKASLDLLARGIPASPGAATGKIVFTATTAQKMAAKGEACILVRHETTPEDIRGMHAAQAVITERGGLTSHAAVIARGLGLPCVVGLSSFSINMREKKIVIQDGRILQEGDTLTIDGANGQVILGSIAKLPPALDDTFTTLMDWAGQAADIQVRVNADTVPEVEMAARFGAAGIGLCRTEHMFFEDGRLTAMREMIFTETPSDRKAALERLLPMQRGDFIQLFEKMPHKPVCIRLFDPPLHEFLPKSANGIRKLAEAMGLSISKIDAMVEALSEFNPMLGLRGVRLGVTQPEIYEMQSRAIFEAVVEMAQRGEIIAPEIMIPLVSARREVELVKASIDAVAARVRAESGVEFTYHIGVMVETPRAALKAGEIAGLVSFLSYGTNDLTQMTYGLSRDDAGRFIDIYVRQGVYEEDPFMTLDAGGVGELLEIGTTRARAAKPGITVSICGEQGGNAASIALCRQIGLDYVSCSPFRVPAARLAAARLALTDKIHKQKSKKD